ncbi:hypothetical protein EVAR_12617_1 [Eumeta japonica]|uniref:Uncharacterized protein n=1 Tax=Eumeta variegata TaxID=151549 RepID=A0A4C1UFN0_EUMVA|nr:hypothetical protein EVAR_12617_1 [Eumeta japonica]
MKDASERFFDIANSHPNSILVSAVPDVPPPPHHFCRRPRNVLLDLLNDLTVEVEKLIEEVFTPCESDTPVCPGTRTVHNGFFSSFPPFAQGKLQRKKKVYPSQLHSDRHL